MPSNDGVFTICIFIYFDYNWLIKLQLMETVFQSHPSALILFCSSEISSTPVTYVACVDISASCFFNCQDIWYFCAIFCNDTCAEICVDTSVICEDACAKAGDDICEIAANIVFIYITFEYSL